MIVSSLGTCLPVTHSVAQYCNRFGFYLFIFLIRSFLPKLFKSIFVLQLFHKKHVPRARGIFFALFIKISLEKELKFQKQQCPRS